MMRELAVLPVFALCGACAHLPTLSPLSSESAAGATTRCRQAFPAQPWRATHTIIATLPFGNNGALLGVTAAGPEWLHAILLSPEGIRLFEGVQASGGPGRASLDVRRAVPPFERGAFAASLMADVGNAFMSPPGDPVAIGKYASGETICRWSPPGAETTDVELDASGPRRIRTFRNLHMTRHIELLGDAQAGFFPVVRLVVPGAGCYVLDMQLVDHE